MPPTGIEPAKKLFCSPTPATIETDDAADVVFFEPLSDVTEPAGSVLVQDPSVVDVRLNETVQTGPV